MLMEYARGISEIPESIKAEQAQGSCGTKCHLDPDCYHYQESLFHPFGCKSRNLNIPEVHACLASRPIYLAGDSRTSELHAGIASALGRWTIRKSHNIHPRPFHETIHRSFQGADLLRFMGGSKYNTSWPDWHGEESKARKKGRKIVLVIGALGAHVVEFRSSIQQLDRSIQDTMHRLSIVLERAKAAQHLISDVIFFWDSRPLRLPYESNYKTVALERLNRATLETLRKYPFVKIWKSHLPAAEEFQHICRSFILPLKVPEAFKGDIAQGISGGPVGSPNRCPDTWHRGNVYGMGIARMLLNYVCS